MPDSAVRSGQGQEQDQEQEPDSEEYTTPSTPFVPGSPPQPKLPYRLFRFLFRFIMKTLFRRMTVINSTHLPPVGPLIIVGNHGNQFVDALNLVACTNRTISFITAKKSWDRRLIGDVAKALNCIPVIRPQDLAFNCKGKVISIDVDWVNKTALLRGKDTNFLSCKEIVKGTKIVCKEGWIGELKLVVTPTDECTLKVGEVTGEQLDSLVRLAGVSPRPTSGRITNGSTSTSAVDFAGVAIAGVSPGATFAGENPIARVIPVSSISHPPSPSPTPTTANATTTTKTTLLPTPLTLKFLPKVSQSSVYARCHTLLRSNGTIGIYPEGGSHDQTHLIPLKAGVTIMALSAASQGIPVKIMCVGLTYSNAHKFRSKGVIQFGQTFECDVELVNLYKVNKKEACSKLLVIITEALQRVTLNTSNYLEKRKMSTIRRLYQPSNIKVLSGLQHMAYAKQFTKGFERVRDTKRCKVLVFEVEGYMAELDEVGYRDSEIARIQRMSNECPSGLHQFALMAYHVLLVMTLVTLSSPAFLLNAPILAICKVKSRTAQAKALKESKVKVGAYDVVMSERVKIGAGVIPLFYAIYGIIAAILVSQIDYQEKSDDLGIAEFFFSKSRQWIIPLLIFVSLPFVSYCCLKMSDTWVCSTKSIKALFRVWKGDCEALLERRGVLQGMVREFVDADLSEKTYVGEYEGMEEGEGSGSSAGGRMRKKGKKGKLREKKRDSKVTPVGGGEVERGNGKQSAPTNADGDIGTEIDKTTSKTKNDVVTKSNSLSTDDIDLPAPKPRQPQIRPLYEDQQRVLQDDSMRMKIESLSNASELLGSAFSGENGNGNDDEEEGERYFED